MKNTYFFWRWSKRGLCRYYRTPCRVPGDTLMKTTAHRQTRLVPSAVSLLSYNECTVRHMVLIFDLNCEGVVCRQRVEFVSVFLLGGKKECSFCASTTIIVNGSFVSSPEIQDGGNLYPGRERRSLLGVKPLSGSSHLHNY